VASVSFTHDIRKMRLSSIEDDTTTPPTALGIFVLSLLNVIFMSHIALSVPKKPTNDEKKYR